VADYVFTMSSLLKYSRSAEALETVELQRMLMTMFDYPDSCEIRNVHDRIVAAAYTISSVLCLEFTFEL